ncbi:MAG TPA: hypothetical protein VKY74_15160 [Chloroflexia bacterium]|nr:hypothetical protein [Chloroflexia bacterium]
MEATDMGQPVAWILDGVGPIPAPIAAWLTHAGEPLRLARFGRVRAVRSHDFGPPAGVRPVVICEKYAAVLLAAAPPWDVQGVLLSADEVLS